MTKQYWYYFQNCECYLNERRKQENTGAGVIVPFYGMRCILQSIHGIRQGHSLGWLEVGKEITSNRYSPQQQLLLHLLQHVLTPRALVSMRKYTKLCYILFNLEHQHGCGKRKSYICNWLDSVTKIMFPNRRCIDRILHHRPILTMELGTSTNIGIYSGCTG